MDGPSGKEREEESYSWLEGSRQARSLAAAAGVLEKVKEDRGGESQKVESIKKRGGRMRSRGNEGERKPALFFRPLKVEYVRRVMCVLTRILLSSFLSVLLQWQYISSYGKCWQKGERREHLGRGSHE